MAFTAFPTSVVDLTHANRNSEHWKVRFEQKFAIGETVQQIILFDPRRNKGLQVIANSQTYSIDVTSHPGLISGVLNTDITGSVVPWTALKTSITSDFIDGGESSNVNILAVRITSSVLTAEFEVYAEQYGDQDDS